MKKLFTIYLPVRAWANYEWIPQPSNKVVVNTPFLQNSASNLAYKNNFKPEINIRLISFNFFVHFATYQKINPLLLTYSAEITQTYKQTLTTSFTFGRPADVFSSVLLGNTPEANTNNNSWCKSYSFVKDRVKM
jgi:hypothetical protein